MRALTAAAIVLPLAGRGGERQDAEPGTPMPDLGVSPGRARDIAEYLFCCT